MEKSFPMTGGHGLNSYSNNSTKQKEGADAAKSLLIEGIIENLEIENIPPNYKFTIADLGCATGPNTFFSINNIIEAVTHKFNNNNNNNNNLPEFQVYFNDHIFNDFNTLFANFPLDKKYFGYGAPGSFYDRLFPKSFLNFAFSAFALHWLSRAPPELNDPNSGICNKGRIHYVNAPKEVCEAYFGQYALDLEAFLSARAEEIVGGGLMAILIPGRPNGTLPSEISVGKFIPTIDSCLVDMANEGILSWGKIDSLNLPVYSPSIDELKNIIQKNNKFRIVKLEKIATKISPSTKFNPRELRSGLENIFKSHFGNEVSEEIFERYAAKFEEFPSETSTTTASGIGLFILLKRYL